jgi:hypothetical protein
MLIRPPFEWLYDSIDFEYAQDPDAVAAALARGERPPLPVTVNFRRTTRLMHVLAAVDSQNPDQGYEDENSDYLHQRPHWLVTLSDDYITELFNVTEG